uniref:Uncharacterized protein n=1 Tax=Tanacetum cinerariifolium TaxID=118510 RepID=A0A699IU37_TANCI|nr:hypothetical protein [Tanacetum cinerariifolium]
MPSLEDITYFNDEEAVGAAANFSNMETTITVSPIPTTRVHNDHHVTQIIGDLFSATQTRSMTRMVKDQGDLTLINNEDFYTCMFACFLSPKEPKRVHQALKDPSWIEAMQEELLQFKMQKLLELMLLKRPKENTKCVSAAGEELTAAKHKLRIKGQVYWLSDKGGCQSYHDSVMDQRPSLLYPHPVWISPALEYPLGYKIQSHISLVTQGHI